MKIWNQKILSAVLLVDQSGISYWHLLERKDAFSSANNFSASLQYPQDILMLKLSTFTTKKLLWETCKKKKLLAYNLLCFFLNSVLDVHERVLVAVLSMHASVSFVLMIAHIKPNLMTVFHLMQTQLLINSPYLKKEQKRCLPIKDPHYENVW